MALTAVGPYSLTVKPDTANTSTSNPQGGSFKTVAVGSNSFKRVIERLQAAALGDIVESVIFFALYDGTNARLWPGSTIRVPKWTTRLNDVPVVSPWCVSVPMPDGKPIEFVDNTWSIITWVYTSQAILASSGGKDWS